MDLRKPNTPLPPSNEKGGHSRFKLPIKRAHKHSETYKNTSSSLSQIHRKLGYKTTQKPFIKKKESSDVSKKNNFLKRKSGNFNLGMSSVYAYDSMYKLKSKGGKNNTKQLPSINMNTFFVRERS